MPSPNKQEKEFRAHAQEESHQDRTEDHAEGNDADLAREIAEFRAGGRTWKAIMAHYEISRQQLRTLAKKYGIK